MFSAVIRLALLVRGAEQYGYQQGVGIGMVEWNGGFGVILLEGIEDKLYAFSFFHGLEKMEVVMGACERCIFKSLFKGVMGHGLVNDMQAGLLPRVLLGLIANGKLGNDPFGYLHVEVVGAIVDDKISLVRIVWGIAQDPFVCTEFFVAQGDDGMVFFFCDYRG